MHTLCSLHASGSCMVHAVYVCPVYVLAAQHGMQPSHDTVHFVVYAGLVRLSYGCHAEVNMDTSLSFYF